MSRLAWVNGRIVDEGEFCLRVRDRGFLYGDGLFETVRVYSGRPFGWDQHLARLAEGCSRLGISYPGELISSGAEELLRRVGDVDGSLRVTVTRGESGRGLLAPPALEPTVAITLSRGAPYDEHAYERGFKAITVSFPRNHLSPLVSLKTLNCLENVLGRREAEAAGADEGIFLNLRGEVAEGTISNVFIVLENREIVTPPLKSGILPGITRKLVIKLAVELGYSVYERPIFPSDILKAKEAFLTNSLLEVMPLVALDGKLIGRGLPGPATLDLRSAYREHVQKQSSGGGLCA
ncbi:MAG: aminotransferase class IV [Thermacetogeniaceae bacterium]